MTMGEYWASGQYDIGVVGSAEWYQNSELQAWMVLMEGDSESAVSASSPLTRTLYSYFVAVLNAHTGCDIGVSPLSAPDRLLVEGQGLDPDLYPRYPFEVARNYPEDIILAGPVQA